MSNKKAILEALVPEAREDAKFSAFLSQQLEQIESTVYRIEYPELKWRRFFPVDTNYAPGVETISFYEWDIFGQAAFISNYAQDLPNVSIRGEKFSSNVESIGASYQYSSQDLRAAALARMPLSSELASAAMGFIERKMDAVTANGQSELGMVGVANHPNVPVDTAADNGGGSTHWEDKTADQILFDLHSLTRAMWEETKELEAPNTVILPTSLYGLVSLKRIGVETGNTVLKMFLAMNPWVTSVESWNRLEEAGADGGPRIIAYKKDPTVVKVAVPMEAVQYEPERRSLTYLVPMEARYGGVLIRKPLAMRYLDGAGPVPS